MEATTETVTQADYIDLQVDTLTGDLRDVLLTHVRSMEDPWSKLPEYRQAEKIQAIQKCAEDLVRKSVQIVAHQGFPHVSVTTGKWEIGDVIGMKIGISRSVDNITKLAEHGNGAAVLVLVEPGEFFGQRQAARAEPDQRAMDLDAVAAAEDGRSAIERYEEMIATSATLSGLSFNMQEWPEDRREAVAAQITAKGGSIIGVDSIEGGDQEDGEAEEPGAPVAEATPAKTRRGSRRRISETEAA